MLTETTVKIPTKLYNEVAAFKEVKMPTGEWIIQIIRNWVEREAYSKRLETLIEEHESHRGC